MKLLLLSLISIILITPQRPLRHFFIGYYIGKEGSYIYGNLSYHTSNGLVPGKNEIMDWYRKTYNDVLFTDKEFIIVGFSEFKNNAECELFFKLQQP